MYRTVTAVFRFKRKFRDTRSGLLSAIPTCYSPPQPEEPHGMSKIINPNISAPVLLQSILDVAIKSTGAERGMLFTFDAQGHMVPRSGRHVTGRDLDPIREMQISQNVIEQVMKARQPQVIEDFGKSSASPWQSVISLRLSWSICVPLITGGGTANEMRGAIYLDSTQKPKAQLSTFLDMLQSLGNAVALSLDNTYLYDRLQREKGRLASIATLSLALNSAADLDELLRSGFDVILQETNSHKGFLMLLESTPNQPQSAKLTFKIGRDRSGNALKESDFSIHRRHLADVIRRGESIFQPSSPNDQQNFSQTVMEFRATFPSFIPLKVVDFDPKAETPAASKPGRSIGVVCVDTFIELGENAKDSLFLLEVLASQLATAIEKHRLVRANFEKEQLDAELRNAESVQKFLLPKTMPEVAGYQFAARCFTTEGPGGDYFDFIELDQGRIAIVQADVSGHSVSASLIACLVRSSIRQSCDHYETPAEILFKANHYLVKDIPHGMFVTVFMAILDLQAMMLTYTNAGAPLPLLFRKHQAEPFELKVGGMPLGIMHPVTYEQETLELDPEDLLLIYTDGVVEADAKGALLGQDGLTRLLQPMLTKTPNEIVQGIHEALVQYTGSERLGDDVTLIGMKCLPSVDNQEFTIYSTAEYVEQATARVLGMLRSKGFITSNELPVRLVLVELIGNAVEHGNRKVPSKRVHVKVRIDPVLADVTVTDEGEGYDVETTWSNLTQTDPTSERGRGLYLVKQYVDTMRANRKGNEITIGIKKGKF